MPSPRNPNLEILLLAANRLGPLVDEMVFLGGCVTGLLVTDSAAPPIRPTKDVDVISEVLSRSDYYRLADKLRELGFREDSSEEAPLCRWIIEGVLLDVMPTDASILGFGNPWYQQALVHARSEEVAPGLTIKVVTAPYFLATKLAAFGGRGSGDYLASHDIEDLIAVIDGRPEIVDEVLGSAPLLQDHLAAEFATLLDSRDFVDALPGQLMDSGSPPSRLPVMLGRIEAIARRGGVRR